MKWRFFVCAHPGFVIPCSCVVGLFFCFVKMHHCGCNIAIFFIFSGCFFAVFLFINYYEQLSPFVFMGEKTLTI